MQITRWFQALCALALLGTSTTPVAAQCVGDCNRDAEVTVDELVLGVNIALGTAQLAACPLLDADASQDVTIDELIAAVNSALNGCSAVNTPTPTAMPGGTPTPPAGCGDGVVDFNGGETCDDGNTADGDACPANCRIASCIAAGTMRTADVSLTSRPGVDIAGVSLFVRYPDGIVRIPGAANDQQVQDRLSNLPDNGFSTPNDLDYGLRMVLISIDQSPFPAGRLFSIAFDDCLGAKPPTAGDFRCTVESAADVDLNSISGVTCTVALP